MQDLLRIEGEICPRFNDTFWQHKGSQKTYGDSDGGTLGLPEDNSHLVSDSSSQFLHGERKLG